MQRLYPGDRRDETSEGTGRPLRRFSTAGSQSYPRAEDWALRGHGTHGRFVYYWSPGRGPHTTRDVVRGEEGKRKTL